MTTESSKCPKCGGDVPRTWINKRRQRVGKCKACGKLVSFGRNSGEQKQTESGAKETRKKEIIPTRKHTAPASGSGDGKSAGIFGRVRGIFNTDIF